MDFFTVKERLGKGGVTEVYPDFRVIRSKDLMVRGRSFYAIWDEQAGLWSTDEYDVQRLIDQELYAYRDKLRAEGKEVQLKLMGEFSSNSWLQFRNYVGHLSDSSRQLDEHLTFLNTDVKKEDYVSRRLPYPLLEGSISAYDEMMAVLYSEEERTKIEWAIGAIISGDAKKIQKFLVLYGPAGTGKSTVLNIIQKLFDGYFTTFEAKALTSNSNAFSTEVFKSNPLVAIQHDGDLSKIEDNTKLNSIVSHEEMTLNEKYKPSYMSRINAFLFMGTNKPVKITDGKSGIIRRLIDVHPTGETLSPKRYQALYSQIDFELGSIAHHCLQVYLNLGKDYYSGYRPVEMMLQTDVFFNFIEAYYDIFKKHDGTTLKQAYELYKEFCKETLIEFVMPRHRFREELKNYFAEFHERAELPDGERVRSWYSVFKADHFKIQNRKDEQVFSLVLDDHDSLLDSELASYPAQYATDEEIPEHRWANVKTVLSDLDTSRLHYVKVPKNHIVIDFDLKDERGEKSFERNLEAASQWPPTYSEVSKSGRGIHLHYNYTGGDPERLRRVYEEGVEVKVYVGDASLRRRKTLCNSVPIAELASGIPLKEENSVISEQVIRSERSLRDLILRNLKKEIHPGTKPSIDFIHKILDDAYSSGLSYDVTDLRSRILAFANGSTNNALVCIKKVQTMQFKSEDVIEASEVMPKDERLVIFDIEVYPNLFVVCWKYHGAPAESIVKMVNPKPTDIEKLLSLKLVGFNCRRYDNHIIYAAYLGYDNASLYALSQKIINNVPNAYFGPAWDLSYADIYDFSSKKQSLKKFQIELGLNHVELDLPWDKPVPKELWDRVVQYCCNDVQTTDEVMVDRMQDFVARQILADLSGLPVNATTQQHTSRIVFGDVKRPQDEFIYTNLSEQFPGYVFDRGQSTYRGEVTGEGGYVYAEPGMYSNVALLDVASMHPTSIEQLDLFGKYTKNFSALKDARIAIKRGDYDSAKQMLGGKLARHLSDSEQAEKLAYALKIVINIVYGLTSAKFDNSFRDPHNVDNIVAKRGALFMIDLKNAVQARGGQVVHIKTDSIKIPNATPELIDYIVEFGKNYGYDFEHEVTYDRFCLVNDAVYIARNGTGSKAGNWTAVGAQFAHPYVFKTLFSGEPIRFADLCETKTVSTALYIDYDTENRPAFLAESPLFIGKAGQFCPMEPGYGGDLVREKDGKFYSAAGAKGYKWLESGMVKTNKLQGHIDMSYFEKLVDDARKSIEQFGDVDKFIS